MDDNDMMTDGAMLDRVLGMLAHALGYAPDGEDVFASPKEITEAAVETIWMYRDLADDTDPLEYRG